MGVGGEGIHLGIGGRMNYLQSGILDPNLELLHLLLICLMREVLTTDLLCRIPVGPEFCSLSLLPPPDGTVVFWAVEDRDRLQKENNAGRVPSASAISVEATAYGLLYVVKQKDTAMASKVARWLTEQRNYQGGFKSTQVPSDTVAMPAFHRGVVVGCLRYSSSPFSEEQFDLLGRQGWGDYQGYRAISWTLAQKIGVLNE